MEDIHILAVRLREVRKKRKFTQAFVAEEVGVSKSSVANWESGKRIPNALEMRELCQLLTVSSDYLCGRTMDYTRIVIPKVYDFDLNRLNSLGKNKLFEYYEFLLTNKEYLRL